MSLASSTSTPVTSKVSTPPRPARRPPPPPKPYPSRPDRKKSSNTVPKEATPSKDNHTNHVSPSNDAPPLDDGGVSAGGISPSIIARIDHRPKMLTPDLERPRLPTPTTPPPSSPPPVPSPPSSPTLRALSPLRFSPPLLPPPLELKEKAMVISQERQVPGSSYSEVTLKTLLRPPIPSELMKDGAGNFDDDPDPYDVTTHVSKPPDVQIDPGHDYSLLQTVSPPPPPLPNDRLYDSIDESLSPSLGERGRAGKERSPRPPLKPSEPNKSRSSSPKPPPPPKPTPLGSSASSRGASGSPMGRGTPPPPPHPRSASPAPRGGTEGLKNESPGPRRKPPVPASRPPPLHPKSPSRLSPAPVTDTFFSKQNSESKPAEEKSINFSEIDIDAITLRSAEVKKEVGHPTTPPHKKGATLPTPTRARPPPSHIYDDVMEFKTKQRSNSLGDPIEDEDGVGVKKPKDPPRRKAPPPPVPKGSPPVTHRPVQVNDRKNLTLGRLPRSDPDIELSTGENKLPNKDIKKQSPATPSPGIKSKFRTFFRGGSKDDSFSGRGSFRKGKGKTDVVITSPTENLGTGSSKTLPAPARPRGRSIDPYMESSGVISAYSYVTIETDDKDDDDDDEGDIPQSFAYTVIDINSVSLRNKKGNKSSEMRRSRSVEHLYDMAGGIGGDGSAKKRSPSPLVKSPSIPEDIDDLSSHIYASVDKTLKNKRKEEVKEEEEREEEEEYAEDEDKADQNEALHDEIDKLDSPPPPVPPFNGHVYAVVSKNGPRVEPTKTDVSPPKANKRAPPPVPAPYSQNSSPESPHAVTTPNEANVPKIVTPPSDTEVTTVTTQAANKYSHLLKKKLPPPSHTPPPPPPNNNGSSRPDDSSTDNLTPTPSLIKPHMTASIDIMKRARHDYEQIDFDELASHSPFSSSCSPNLSSSFPSSTPPSFAAPPIASLASPATNSLSTTPTKRVVLSKTLPPPHKLRELKPKDRPAPPPPFSKKSKDDSKLSSTAAISPVRHGKYSVDGSMHQFLFSDRRTTSFIEAGGPPDASGPLMSPSASSSTIYSSPMDAADDESDVSSDWDASSEEEEDKKEQKEVKPKIYYIAREILTTERTFVKGLKLLHVDFRQHMVSANNAHEKPVVTEEILSQILSNIGSLYLLNSELLKELEARMSAWDTEPRLGDIFVKRAPYLKMYSQYISNFDTALKTLEEQQKKNSLFSQVIKEFELEPMCSNLTVAAYLLETVQRIPRYKLLLADYIKHLEQDSADREDSEKALSIISSVATHVNETIRQMDNFRKTVEVSKRLIGDVGDSLLSPHRKLLKEGELVKSSRKEKQPRMFFLFTDLLIYASAIPPANNTYRVIKRIPLDGMRVQLLDDPELKNGFQIISTCKSFRLDAASSEERNQWLQAFESAIKDHTQRVRSRQINRTSVLVECTDGGVTDSKDLGSLAPPWLPDSSVSMCQLCSIHFTVTRRRHHCRACGMIFCGECSSYMVPLPYKNNKMSRVCQTCYNTLSETTDDVTDLKPVGKRRSLRQSQKKISLPSVLREVRARDESAQISGYLFYRDEKSRSWKRKWFVVYDMVIYQFKRHEDVSAQRSVPLPGYTVVPAAISDPLVFCLQHTGAGRIQFKTEDKEQLDRWVEILTKAVKIETDT
ncbi:PREDICTED: nascent polypeptide-associated complex subunit alpha, muscle-specific form-like isoform X2 [Amphimedon queenslandica]|nr:PREDICTED: nascent polypeptide-associated complex subunit alpha, muscle-specific form-like isoform X2 [Amphimedon queenslandica]|eukprot:XP_019855450.1 PREDICTED: nascent polypeptide-associated complex subunit alpha, muscle-specific form-like isoform X2 [Amphimedon queenslandica]